MCSIYAVYNICVYNNRSGNRFIFNKICCCVFLEKKFLNTFFFKHYPGTGLKFFISFAYNPFSSKINACIFNNLQNFF